MLEPPQISHLAPEISRHLERKSLVERRDEVRQQYAAFFDRIQNPTKCVACNTIYLPLDNFKRKGCRIHTKNLIFYQGRYVWECCGNEDVHRGCVSCMHTDNVDIRESMERDPAESIVEIAMEIIDLELVICNKNMINDYRDGSPSIEKRPGKFYHINRIAIYPE